MGGGERYSRNPLFSRYGEIAELIVLSSNLLPLSDP